MKRFPFGILLFMSHKQLQVSCFSNNMYKRGSDAELHVFAIEEVIYMYLNKKRGFCERTLAEFVYWESVFPLRNSHREKGCRVQKFVKRLQFTEGY
jgi:hypothetical protein